MKRTLPAAALAGLLTAGLFAPAASALPTNTTKDAAPDAPGATLSVTSDVDDCERPEFADNNPGSAFYQAVRWMSCADISSGYSSDNTFRKTRDITRGESAAFLHRMVKPSDFDAPEESPFGDVNVGGAYYVPITWAEAEGVTVGQKDGNFGITSAVTRGQFAAFLYRLEDPYFTAPEESPFGDVNVGGANFRAISWLAENRISVGDTHGDYNQLDAISRGEMAQMLLKYTEKKENGDFDHDHDDDDHDHDHDDDIDDDHDHDDDIDDDHDHDHDHPGEPGEPDEPGESELCENDPEPTPSVPGPSLIDSFLGDAIISGPALEASGDAKVDVSWCTDAPGQSHWVVSGEFAKLNAEHIPLLLEVLRNIRAGDEDLAKQLLLAVDGSVTRADSTELSAEGDAMFRHEATFTGVDGDERTPFRVVSIIDHEVSISGMYHLQD